MGRVIYAEKHFRTYLISLAKPDGYAIGLILGQRSEQKDYIVHLAKTLPSLNVRHIEEESHLVSSPTPAEQDAADKGRYITSLKDLPTNWVADHAKQVTRMLPGGMWVLGIFVVGPEDVFDNVATVENLELTLAAICNTMSRNKYLYGDNQDEKLILSFNSITQKHVCKSVNVAETNKFLKPANWRFREKATTWYQLEALVDLDRLYLIAAADDFDALRRQLYRILTDVEILIDSSLVVIEGEVYSPDDSLKRLVNKKKNDKECKSKANDGDNSLQVSLYIPCSQDKNKKANNVEWINQSECSGLIRLIGQLVSRTFVHEEASIAEANKAVKEDIVRSLASRLELHWASLIQEENGSPEENITLHEPPRRVLIALPENKITLSDYLFPGEGPQEALLSLQELLDLEVQESQVQKEIELQAEFYCQNDVNTKQFDNNATTSSKQELAVYLTRLSVTIIILLIAVFVHQFVT